MRCAPRLTLVLGLGAVLAVGGAQLANASGKWFLWNTSPSEPPGLYVRSGGSPRPGELVAFMAPPPAFPYADHRLGELHHIPIIKAVAAGEGMMVCTRNEVLSIAGRLRAPIAKTDRHGSGLPHWHDCRTLRASELFVFSDRIPNSFDSRYYGPIRAANVISTYRPLWIFDARKEEG